MTQMPARPISHRMTGPGRVVALFLARLMAYLVRCYTSGQTRVLPNIACMVASADEIVRVYVCNLAALRLRSAGYRDAAKAMRITRADRLVNVSPSQMAPASPEALIARLEHTIAAFEEAETLSLHLACIMFCALCMVSAGEATASLPSTALGILLANIDSLDRFLSLKAQLSRWRRTSPAPLPKGRGPPSLRRSQQRLEPKPERWQGTRWIGSGLDTCRRRYGRKE